MKLCKICDNEKPTEQFIKMTGGYRSPYCNKCRKEYNRKNNLKIKKLKQQKGW